MKRTASPLWQHVDQGAKSSTDRGSHVYTPSVPSQTVQKAFQARMVLFDFQSSSLPFYQQRVIVLETNNYFYLLSYKRAASYDKMP